MLVDMAAITRGFAEELHGDILNNLNSANLSSDWGSTPFECFPHLSLGPTMSTPPSPRAILSLYSSTLRAARSFSSYNFRNYFLDRTKENFRSMQAEKDPAKLAVSYNEAVKELAMLRRSAIVNQLYGGWRLAVEQQSDVRGKGDT